MATIQVIEIDGSQAVRLPDEFRFSSKQVTIRKEGQAVVLEPVRPKSWPSDFFERIAVDDPAFERPDQGNMPPPPSLE